MQIGEWKYFQSPETQLKALLTIAGTDPSGGAGIQVDLQVFRDFGFHGLSAITAVVWQNTVGVRGFETIEPVHVCDQIDAVVDDIPVAGIKIGMLARAETVEMVGRWLARRSFEAPVVLDPVLTSGSSGSSLHRPGMVEQVRSRLVPEVDCLTPNVPEAEALLEADVEIGDEGTMLEAAERLCEQGAGAVLLKGGHFAAGDGGGGAEEDEATIRDVLAVGDGEAQWLEPLERVEADVRGTGCQLSSAVCAELSRGRSMREAVERSRRYLNRKLRCDAERIGRGRPVVVRGERLGPDGGEAS